MISFYLSDKGDYAEHAKNLTKWLLEFLRNLLVLSTITFFAIKLEKDPISFLIKTLLYIGTVALYINTYVLTMRMNIRLTFIKNRLVNITVSSIITLTAFYFIGKIIAFIINASVATLVYSQLPHNIENITSQNTEIGYFTTSEANSHSWLKTKDVAGRYTIYQIPKFTSPIE